MAEEPARAWTTRAEVTGTDRSSIREVLLAAFPTNLEADLVEALRADPQAWLAHLSGAIRYAPAFGV